MVSVRLLSIVRCPGCRAAFHSSDDALECPSCGGHYQARDGFLDLRPREQFSEQTKYLDETLHADARHETVSPPLLSAGVRHHMLVRFLQPAAGDRVLDLGCGSGRVLVWNQPLGPYQVGLDVSPFFAAEARASVDLALGDLRRLPFADCSFNKAYALDVFEHLSRDALGQMLDEASRILEPAGQLFVYSHVRKNARIAVGLRAINRLARGLERAGLVDLSQERLRKSDHVNPLADIPDLEQVVGQAGFRVAHIRYYTPLVAGFIENILLRLGERWLTRRAQRKAAAQAPAVASTLQTPHAAATGPGQTDPDAQEAARASRAAFKARVARGGPIYFLLHVLTWMSRLDLVLWGRVRSGPFFALLVKERAR
jgi:SAM-dependent methyltransferase